MVRAGIGVLVAAVAVSLWFLAGWVVEGRSVGLRPHGAVEGTQEVPGASDGGGELPRYAVPDDQKKAEENYVPEYDENGTLLNPQDVDDESTVVDNEAYSSYEGTVNDMTTGTLSVTDFGGLAGTTDSIPDETMELYKQDATLLPGKYGDVNPESYSCSSTSKGFLDCKSGDLRVILNPATRSVAAIVTTSPLEDSYITELKGYYSEVLPQKGTGSYEGLFLTSLNGMS